MFCRTTVNYRLLLCFFFNYHKQCHLFIHKNTEKQANLSVSFRLSRLAASPRPLPAPGPNAPPRPRRTPSDLFSSVRRALDNSLNEEPFPKHILGLGIESDFPIRFRFASSRFDSRFASVIIFMISISMFIKWLIIYYRICVSILPLLFGWTSAELKNKTKVWWTRMRTICVYTSS